MHVRSKAKNTIYSSVRLVLYTIQPKHKFSLKNLLQDLPCAPALSDVCKIAVFPHGAVEVAELPVHCSRATPIS